MNLGLQKHCPELSPRRAAEVVVDTMLEHPDDDGDDDEGDRRRAPQLEAEGPDEDPTT